MKSYVAKNKTIPSKPDGFSMPLSLQEDLTAAIHGAFEVAVEIAVLEVTKLVSVAAVDMYEKIQQENETLKQELQKTKSAIDSVRTKAGNDSSQNNQPVHANTHDNITSAAHNVYNSDQDGRETPPADQHHKEQGAGHCFKSQGDAVLDLQEQLNCCANDSLRDKQTKLCLRESKGTEINKGISLDCAVKEENTNQSCNSEEARGCSLPAVCFTDTCPAQPVKVKEENPEEIRNASNCLVDSYKEEAISQLQSEIIEDWMPGVSDFQNEEQNTSLSCISQAQGHPPNINFSLEPDLDSSSLNIDFPVTAQMTDQVPIREPPTQIYGGHVRRNQGHTTPSLHTCKLCGQTFPLPSLLRRHYGQCQQKLSQRQFVPVAGGKRPKLQLYPPGCSPFRCTECNREFNRLENLKTHLRIHTGERPYKCSVCSTCFRHSGALTRHFRIHTGEKPYVCGHCGKSFRNCGGLKFHQRSHNK